MIQSDILVLKTHVNNIQMNEKFSILGKTLSGNLINMFFKGRKQELGGEKESEFIFLLKM